MSKPSPPQANGKVKEAIKTRSAEEKKSKLLKEKLEQNKEEAPGRGGGAASWTKPTRLDEAHASTLPWPTVSKIATEPDAELEDVLRSCFEGDVFHNGRRRKGMGPCGLYSVVSREG